VFTPKPGHGRSVDVATPTAPWGWGSVGVGEGEVPMLTPMPVWDMGRRRRREGGCVPRVRRRFRSLVIQTGDSSTLHDRPRTCFVGGW
jgi:hypothetical protein